MAGGGGVTERPILMSGPMVRTTLADRKTNTRRLMKVPPGTSADGVYCDRYNKSDRWAWWLPDGRMVRPETFACPYGAVGDRLWVREAWRTSEALDKLNATQIAAKALDANYKRPWAPIVYGDGVERDWDHDSIPVESGGWGGPGRRRLGRFMPRWLSRITIEVTGVRVERLQGISEEDAKAEGLSPITKDGHLVKYGIPDRDGLPGTGNDGWPWQEWEVDPRKAFRKLWDSINHDRAPWASNPFVWVVAFKRIDPTKVAP